jgi:AraC-like DNA-binding protein
MSRSAFVDRFTTLIGMPPIRYLTIWRLQTAKLSLRETRKTIVQLAQEVGYGSGEAFQPGVQTGILAVTRAVARPAAGGVMPRTE